MRMHNMNRAHQIIGLVLAVAIATSVLLLRERMRNRRSPTELAGNRGLIATNEAEENWAQSYDLAKTLLESGRIVDARNQYQKLLDINADRVSALVGLAACAREECDYLAALGYYDAALELNHRSFSANLGKGSVLIKLGRWKEAVLAYEIARDRNPRSPLPYWGLVVAYDHLEQGADVIKNYREFEARANDSKYRRTLELIVAKYDVGQERR